MNKIMMIAACMIGVLIAGCSSDDDNDNSNPAPTPTPNPYFIEGKVDGVMFRAQYTCPYPGCLQTAGHYSEFMNQVVMQRTMSATNQVGWDVMVTEVTLDSWTLPDTLDASSFFGNENLNLSFYTGPWESDNNYLVDGTALGDNSCQMIVSSKINDIIEGTFSGQLRNGSDMSLVKTVTNGKFKIKVARL